MFNKNVKKQRLHHLFNTMYNFNSQAVKFKYLKICLKSEISDIL